jgi:hypothetical protein
MSAANVGGMSNVNFAAYLKTLPLGAPRQIARAARAANPERIAEAARAAAEAARAAAEAARAAAEAARPALNAARNAMVNESARAMHAVEILHEIR